MPTAAQHESCCYWQNKRKRIFHVWSLLRNLTDLMFYAHALFVPVIGILKKMLNLSFCMRNVARFLPSHHRSDVQAIYYNVELN